MKKIICVGMVLMGLSIIGCQKEEIKPKTEQQEFVASLANQVTRTTVTDDGKVSWVSTDAIGIFDEGKTSPVKATIKSISADGKTAVFTPVTEIVSAVGAIYPYDANATLSGNVVSISLGATQSGDFADANVAASKANGYNLSFRNATSVFKFKVTDENAKSVKLNATGIAGTLNITLGNTISSTLNEGSTSDEITVSNITPSMDYYIAVAPKAYDDFQYSWYDNGGEKLGTVSLGKNITIGAGELFEWGDLVEHKDIECVKFTDANFKAYCVNNFDTDGDGEISIEEALTITDIEVKRNDISSLDGIEYFINLNCLSCDSNQLTSLDVSKNTALTKLTCDSNQLTTLDVSGCTALTELYCYFNRLTSLDVSKNTALTKLTCDSNQLTTLDVSKNTALTFLNCSYNLLTSLDVSKNTALTELYCYFNRLTSLDVSKNTALTKLDCNSNDLTIQLNVLNNTALTFLNCSYNLLTSLDVSKNTALTFLNCSYNLLTSLDVSKNTALTYLGCNSNQLTSLDVSDCTALTALDCDSNQLTSLDVSKNTALTSLNCSRNQIKIIYVWKGFDSSQYPHFNKDDFAEYFEVGNVSGNIQDFTVKNPWDI